MSKKMAVQNQLYLFVSSQASLGPCLFRPILLTCPFANSCARRNKALNVRQSSVSYPVSHRAGDEKDLVVRHQQSFVISMTGHHGPSPPTVLGKQDFGLWASPRQPRLTGITVACVWERRCSKGLSLMDEDAGSCHLLALLFSSASAKAINCRIATPSTAPPRCREYRGAKAWARGE